MNHDVFFAGCAVRPAVARHRYVGTASGTQMHRAAVAPETPAESGRAPRRVYRTNGLWGQPSQRARLRSRRLGGSAPRAEAVHNPQSSTPMISSGWSRAAVESRSGCGHRAVESNRCRCSCTSTACQTSGAGRSREQKPAPAGCCGVSACTHRGRLVEAGVELGLGG